MKKTIIIAGLVLIVLLIAISLVISFKMGYVIKVAVETVGPKLTGGTVTMETAKVRPFAGKASLKGILVGNPDGYKTPSAFELGEVSIKMDIRSITSDTIIIEDVYIKGPIITFEKSLKKSNISQMLSNIEIATGANAAKGGEEEPPADDAAPGKKVVIRHVLIVGAKIQLSTALLMGKTVNLPLPKIELYDIGKDKDGVSFGEAISIILAEILKGVTKVIGDTGDLAVEGAKAVGDAAMKAGDVAADGAKAAGEVATKGAKAVGGATAEVTKDTGKAIGAGASKVAKGIGGLLGKDKDKEKE